MTASPAAIRSFGLSQTSESTPGTTRGFDSQELTRDILDHMVRRVEATIVDEWPFPHLVISQLFPEEFYWDLLDHLPCPSLYGLVHVDRHTNHLGETSRTRFGLTDADLSRLPERQERSWRAARDALGAPEFQRAVFHQLRQGLAYRYGVAPENAHALPGFALPELFRETAGYSIAPHPDTRRKVVTMQVALPRDDSQIDLGTSFYRLSLKPSAWRRRPFGFETVRRIPFLPNSAYAFVVLNTVRRRSWHGREELRPDCGVRNTILNLYYENAADANPDLARMNQSMSPEVCLRPASRATDGPTC